VSGRVSDVTLLTGGRDKPYALGVAAALTAQGLEVDVVGGDDIAVPALTENPSVRFFNLKGDQSEAAPLFRKMTRVVTYYARLIRFAARTETPVFHILWNNKFEAFDRTVLLWYYRALGKRLVFTAHNVNARERDANDSWFNRLTLKVMYHSVDHVFVHTLRMKEQLIADFNVSNENVSVIPFGANDTVPRTALTRSEARQRLKLGPDDTVLLFFGNIAPYKGLEYLVDALARLAERRPSVRLLIVGNPKGPGEYWPSVHRRIRELGLEGRVVECIRYVDDSEVEVFFKASDVFVLPYTHIFQSGVLVLGYGFGVPVVVTAVGSLPDEVVEGVTGCVCAAADAADLARGIDRLLDSDLWRDPEESSARIRAFAADRYSWTLSAQTMAGVYQRLEPRPNRHGCVSDRGR
jgi:D-inositol-3-phosphate glycosyltransferase